MAASDKKSTQLDSTCRWCGGGLVSVFEQQVLGKYPVRYLECAECHSLQTERPYWLEEAYGKNLSSLDTGAAQRNIDNAAACLFVSRLFRLKNAIDFGGGDGLFCRLLRDHEINCFISDKYANPTYAQGYTEPDFSRADLLTAFEVLEHLPDPAIDLDRIFCLDASVIVATTEVYNGQDKQWWYLAPESGQHVFFYSREALEAIARKYRYAVVYAGNYQLFFKETVSLGIRSWVLKLLLHSRVIRILRVWMVWSPGRGAWQDHLQQKKMMGQRCE